MIGKGVKAPKQLLRAKHTVWFEGPLIRMPASQAKENYPKDQTGKLTVDSTAELGFRRWRVWTPQGVSPTRTFVIGNLPEVVEKEVDGQPIPTAVNLPVTVNGRVFPREDIDIWTFRARKGHAYACEVMASRIGSPLDSHLEVRGPDGQRVAENNDELGSDSRIKFVAPADGVYQVRIYDTQYKGLQSYVYRLTITDGPYIQSVYPLGGKAGATTEFEVDGQNVPNNKLTVNLPKSARSDYMHSAMINATPSNLFPIDISNLTEILEAEPNDNPAKTQAAIQLPAVLNGRINKPGDVDSWLVSGKKGDVIHFDVKAARLGSPLDTLLTLETVKGKRLANNDNISNAQSDSATTYTFKNDQTIVVKIASGQADDGSRAHAYRLVADRRDTKPTPHFKLTLPKSELTLNIGQTAKLTVNAARTNYTDEIPLIIGDLPKGVTVSGNKIPKGKNKATITLKADKEIGVSFGQLKIQGELNVGGKKTLITATKPATSALDVEIDRCFLAVALPTPWKVVGIFQTRYAARGSTYFRKYSIKRGDYKGPLTVKMSDTQARHLQGVTGATIHVPAGESEFVYPIKLAPWMEVGRTCRVTVMAIGKVKDPAGKEHVVSYTSLGENQQIIVLVDPGQLTVDSNKQSFLAKPRGSLKVKVRIGRGGVLKGRGCKIELVMPKHIKGIRCKPVKIGPKETIAELKVQFAAKIGPLNAPLVVRATAMIDGYPYTAEQNIEFRTEE